MKLVITFTYIWLLDLFRNGRRRSRSWSLGDELFKYLEFVICVDLFSTLCLTIPTWIWWRFLTLKVLSFVYYLYFYYSYLSTMVNHVFHRTVLNMLVFVSRRCYASLVFCFYTSLVSSFYLLCYGIIIWMIVGPSRPCLICQLLSYAPQIESYFLTASKWISWQVLRSVLEYIHLEPMAVDCSEKVVI